MSNDLQSKYYYVGASIFLKLKQMASQVSLKYTVIQIWLLEKVIYSYKVFMFFVCFAFFIASSGILVKNIIASEF